MSEISLTLVLQIKTSKNYQWQRYNKNLRKSALLAEYFSFWRDQGDRSLIFYFERGKDSGVKATSVFFVWLGHVNRLKIL